MIPSQHAEFVRVLSSDRMSTYLAAADGDLDLAFRLYQWNDDCAEAFQRPLRWLEVALRNGIHDALRMRVGRGDWWADGGIVLSDLHKANIEDAVRRIKKRRKPVKDGSVVAELSFGFWVGLFGPGRNYEMVLWRPTLRRVFWTYRGTRKQMRTDLDRLRTLRNRIAHGEPIFHRDLAADYRATVRLLRLLSPSAADWVDQTCTVHSVLRSRPQRALTG